MAKAVKALKENERWYLLLPQTERKKNFKTGISYMLPGNRRQLHLRLPTFFACFCGLFDQLPANTNGKMH